jgi:hypothetical protein
MEGMGGKGESLRPSRILGADPGPSTSARMTQKKVDCGFCCCSLLVKAARKDCANLVGVKGL